ncbi:mechanosensitive ion channel family protein, partial [Streptomyces spectabilis]
MDRALTLHDLMFAGIAVVCGFGAALLSRATLRWLGVRATRTRWNGDDV